MFYLNDLPDKKVLEKYSEKYTEFDIEKFDSCIKLLKAGSMALTAFESFLGSYNLSQARFLVLMILMRNSDKFFSATEIAEKMGVKKPTITGIIDGLIKESLVSREINDADRRRFKIRITEQGIMYTERILPDYFKYINKIMSGFTQDELTMFKSLLNNTMSNVASIID